MLERLLRSPEFAFTEEAVLLESARLIFARPGARSAHVGTWYQWLEAQALWRVEERWQRWLAASTDDIIAGKPVPPPPPAPVDRAPRQTTRASHAPAATLGSDADFDPRLYQPRQMLFVRHVCPSWLLDGSCSVFGWVPASVVELQGHSSLCGTLSRGVIS